MKRTCFPCLLLIAFFPFLLNRGCLKEPVASFTADRTTIDAGESVQFSDLSENEPDFWAWTFEGGTPGTSELPDPVVNYPYTGSYSVILEVRNRKSSDMVTLDDYIMVLPTDTDVTFVNNTHTPVDILVASIVKTIASGDSVTFFDLEGTSVDFYAETYATTSGGEQIGRLLYWDYFVNLSGSKVSYELNIGTDFFFLFIINSGTRTIGPVEVDDGDTEPLIAEVGLPNNGTQYRIGYFNAWSQTQVRAYHQDVPSQYTYWNANQQFSFPQVMNQSVVLTNTFKKGTAVVQGPARVVTGLGEALQGPGQPGGLPGKHISLPASGSKIR